MNLAQYLDDALDEDAFLPTPGDGLANIFIGSKREKETDKSLKFVPPKPSEVVKSSETSGNIQATSGKKSSECLLGKAVQAYELVNSVYESKGKLGLAIMKILNPACESLVVFNGAKVTLSSVTLTKKFEVTVQNGNYITYYDDSSKNWSLLLSNTQDLNEVLEILRKYNVKIHDKAVQSSSESSGMEIGVKQSSAKFETRENEIDQSSLKSKQSVISRMAKVGHAIIIPPTVLSDQSSDASADESSFQRSEPLLPSKKPLKYTKRSETQRGLTESSDSSSKSIENVQHFQTSSIVPVTHANSIHSSNLYTVCNDRLVSTSNSDISNLNIFMSETRMNNSEVRMNINRISDKVDKVLEHIVSLENTSPSLPSSVEFSSSFTTEIYHKLLREYEDKIKMKESVITTLQEQLKNLEFTNLKSTLSVTEIPEVDLEEVKNKSEMISLENSVLKSEIKDLRSSLAFKIKEAENLLSTVKQLENQCMAMEENCEKLCNFEEENKTLKDMILSLEAKLASKENEKCCNNKETNTDPYKDGSVQCHSDKTTSELKKIMNSVFRELATQFEDDQSYTGAVVCTVIASVIKKTTLDAWTNIDK